MDTLTRKIRSTAELSPYMRGLNFMPLEKEDDAFDEAFNEVASERKTDEPSEDNTELNEVDPKPADNEDEANPDIQDTGDADEDQEVSWKEKFEKLEQSTKSWDGRLQKSNSEREAAEQEREQLRLENEALAKKLEETKKDPEGDTDDSNNSAEDDELLETFKSEYPDLVKPLQALINKANKPNGTPVSQDVINELVEKQLSERLKPIEERNRSEGEKAHFNAIKDAHPDYQSYLKDGELDKWIDSQPTIVQDSYRRVLKSGNAEEVIELFDSYSGGREQKNDERNDVNKNSHRDKQANDHEAIRHRSGGAPRGRAKANDFDGAFEEATASSSK